MLVMYHPIKGGVEGYLEIVPQTDFEKAVIAGTYKKPRVCFDLKDDLPVLKVFPEKKQKIKAESPMS